MQDKKINKAYAMLGMIKQISKNFKLHITVQEYGEVSFRLLQQCMVHIQKRRHGGYRKGSEKGN